LRAALRFFVPFSSTSEELVAGGPYKSTAKKEGALSAAIQIVIVAALVGGGIFFYKTKKDDQKLTMDTAVEAKKATEGDDAPAYLKAESLFAKIPAEKIEASDAIMSSLAEVESQLYFTYGVKDAGAKAKKYLDILKAHGNRTAERYAAEAYVLLGDGNAAEAEKIITDLTDKGIRHAKLLHVLSAAKLAQGKMKEAAVAAQEGQKLSTSLVRLPIAEGDALLALGNIPSAANAYLKAKKLNPDHMRARTALTLVAAVSRQGKPDLLIKELDRLLEETKTNPGYGGTPPPRVQAFIEYAKGEVFLVDNKAKEALAMAEAATVTDPTQPAAFALKGRSLAKLGKAEDAKKAFDDALALSPASLPIGKAAYDVLAAANKGADGIAYLEKVKTANPENGMVYVELSLAQSAANKPKEALANADEAIAKLGNAHDLAVFAKARALQADNQLDKARETYGEAIGYHGNPEWPELYFAMGQLRFAEKQYEEAAQNYEQAVKFWDKQGGSIDRVADAYEGMGKSYDALGKKKKREAAEAYEKAAQLRKGEKA
jgi:tetratricopeptide (TPR) repeat protein